MKNTNYLFLGFAVTAVICMMLIGIAIAERSMIGIMLAIAATIIVVGTGFTMKKKMREQGRL